MLARAGASTRQTQALNSPLPIPTFRMRLLSLFTLLCGAVAVSAGGHAAGATTFAVRSKLSLKDTPQSAYHQKDLTVEETSSSVPSVRGGAGPFKPSAVAQFATIITILK